MTLPRRRFGRRALAALLLAAAGTAMATEQPEYEVVDRAPPIELRRYAPMVVAETVVDGDLSSASNRGFRRIAGYIFGGNRSVRTDQAGERIAMTAPVITEPVSERIAMTAPVTVEPQDRSDPDALARADRWRIAFVMPKAYTLATLPRPDDPTVTLREVPGSLRAVITFSGLAGERAVREATDTLLAWIDARGLKTAGTPVLARYDPPWTLPFLRRNEVMVGIVAP